MESSKIVDVSSHGFKVSVMSRCCNHYRIQALVRELLKENPHKDVEELKALIEKKLTEKKIANATVVVITG